MTFLQVLNQFLSENPDYNEFVFRTATETEARALVKTLYKLGFYWNVNEPYSDEETLRRWHQKKKETCISLGTMKSSDKKQLFNGRQGMFTNQGRMIVNVATLFEEVEGESVDFVANAPLDNSKKLCPQCYNEIASKANFCNNCGYKFENIETKKDVLKQQDNENKNDIQKQDAPIPFLANEAEEKDDILNTETENTEISINTDTAKVFCDNNQKEIKTKSEKAQLPVLCQILNIDIDQPFKISNFAYNSDNNVFRINSNGYREKKVGPDRWFITNNEQELEYIIENKKQIIKL